MGPGGRMCMRQNVIVALLSVIATLLLVIVLSPHPVTGQNATGNATIGAEVAVATGSMQGGTGSALYLYDTKDKILAVYFLGNSGLELRAVRDLQWDLQAVEYNGTQGKLVKVADMRTAVKKQQKSKADRAEKTEEEKK